MTDIDFFAKLLERAGEPEHAQKIAEREAAAYQDKVPPALIRFWIDHGRGSFQQGKFWICDPAPFKPVIEQIFEGDPEFDPADMQMIGYDAFAKLTIWHRKKRNIYINMLRPDVFNPSSVAYSDKMSGEVWSEDATVGRAFTIYLDMDEECDNRNVPLLRQAIDHLGLLRPGEIYGFFPPLVLGGDETVANLKRVDAPIHMSILAQFSKFPLTRMTAPEPPDYPYGRIEVIRLIGTQRGNRAP